MGLCRSPCPYRYSRLSLRHTGILGLGRGPIQEKETFYRLCCSRDFPAFQSPVFLTNPRAREEAGLEALLIVGSIAPPSRTSPGSPVCSSTGSSIGRQSCDSMSGAPPSGSSRVASDSRHTERAHCLGFEGPPGQRSPELSLKEGDLSRSAFCVPATCQPNAGPGPPKNSSSRAGACWKNVSGFR